MNKGVTVLGLGLGFLGLVFLMKKTGGTISGQVRELNIDSYDNRLAAGNDISMTVSFAHKGPNELIPLKVYLDSHKILDDTYNVGSSEDWNTVGTGIYAPTSGIPVGFYDLKVTVANISITLPNAVEIYSEGGGQITDVHLDSVDIVGENYNFEYTITWTGNLNWAGGWLYINGVKVASLGVTLLDATSPYHGNGFIPRSVSPDGGVFHLELNGVSSNIVNV